MNKPTVVAFVRKTEVDPYPSLTEVLNYKVDPVLVAFWLVVLVGTIGFWYVVFNLLRGFFG